MRRNEVEPGYGEWLRFYRERAGFTQRQLANAAGVSYVTVNHLENDRRLASDRVARLLAKQLALKPGELFPEDGRLTPSAVIERYLKLLEKRKRASK